MVIIEAGKVSLDLLSSKFTFKWEIHKFHLMECKDVGDGLQSPKFTTYTAATGETQWCLTMYPNGDSETAKNFLSIYLDALSSKIKAAAEFKFLDDENEVVVTKRMNLREDIFGSQGFRKCLSSFLLTKTGILSNNRMTVVCEITVSANEMDEMKLHKEVVQEQEDDIQARLEVIKKCEALFENNKFYDVSLISEGKAVKAHKCILANSSSVFAAVFDADMKESQENTLQITDIKYDVLVELIRFVYAGKANNIDALAGELAVAADKYALDGLKNTCEKTMITNLSIDNVIDCLQLADNLLMDKLKEKAIEFIVEKGSDVTEKPEFKLLPSDIICKICRSTVKRHKKS